MICFVKITKVGNKFVLVDSEGNSIHGKQNPFIDTLEEAEELAEACRYAFLYDDDEDDEEIPKGMFWEWWNDLCDISSLGMPLIAHGYFYDKIYNYHENETLEQYLDYIANLTW